MKNKKFTIKKFIVLIMSCMLLFVTSGCEKNEQQNNDIYLSYAQKNNGSIWSHEAYDLFFNYIYTDTRTLLTPHISAKINGNEQTHFYINGKEKSLYSSFDVPILTPYTSITLKWNIEISDLQNMESVTIEIHHTNQKELVIAQKIFSSQELLDSIQKFENFYN